MGKFFGRNDARRITLERLFPHGDITFSTPIWESGRYRLVVVEGIPETLEVLGEYIRDLALRQYIEERFFGRWYGFGTHETTGGLQVQYDSLEKPVNQLQLLDFVLRAHLVKYCDLKLLPVSVIVGYSDGSKFMEIMAPLPVDIGNGATELAKRVIPRIIH
jgi:hypothetical protein